MNKINYAIVEISGRQFWIESGRYYDLNRIPTDLGNNVKLHRTLLINGSDNIKIGQPYIETANIFGKIIKHFKGKKLLSYKMKSKKKTRKKKGYRQKLTRVLIDNIKIKELI